MDTGLIGKEDDLAMIGDIFHMLLTSLKVDQGLIIEVFPIDILQKNVALDQSGEFQTANAITHDLKEGYLILSVKNMARFNTAIKKHPYMHRRTGTDRQASN